MGTYAIISSVSSMGWCVLNASITTPPCCAKTVWICFVRSALSNYIERESGVSMYTLRLITLVRFFEAVFWFLQRRHKFSQIVHDRRSKQDLGCRSEMID